MSPVDERQVWPEATPVPGGGTVWVLRDPDTAPPALRPYGAVRVVAVDRGDESDDPEGRGRARELVLQSVEFGPPAIPAAFDLFEAYYQPETGSTTADLDDALDALESVR